MHAAEQAPVGAASTYASRHMATTKSLLRAFRRKSALLCQKRLDLFLATAVTKLVRRESPRGCTSAVAFAPESIPQLNEIVTALESDDRVKVVVFDSAVEGFFITRCEFFAKLEDSTNIPAGPTGLQALPDMLVRISRALVVAIASIRGRATGVGSELGLASDMRFASRETAILSQWEVSAALVPGGGLMARLPRLIGRGRALEVLLGADDIRGDIAELYGYVNRAVADAELDAFVDALATRIASFDKEAIADTKRLVNVATLPPDDEIAPEWTAFIASSGRPAAETRIKALMERGFHNGGDVGNRLGYYVGQLDA
jgi:enoyl-CoA hydratase/carnithine racemase